MPASAVSCADVSCRRTTKHASGRCHDHRDAARRPISAQAVPSPRTDLGKATKRTKKNPDGSTTEEWKIARTLHRLDGPAWVMRDPEGNLLEERYYEWGVSRRTDGPATLFYEDGAAYEETWKTGDNGEVSRVGGPATVEYRTNRSKSSESYFYEGRAHRVDGPGRITYRDGAPKTQSYRLDGEYVSKENFAERLRAYSGVRLREEFERSSYAALLDEGVNPEAIVDAIAEDVWTVEGIREVVGGAPAEWVRAYEASSV